MIAAVALAVALSAPVQELPRLRFAGPLVPASEYVAETTCKEWTREEMHKRTYVFRVLVSLNQVINAATGGWPDETLSSRLGRAARRGSRAGRAVCGVLDRVDPCHCDSSIEFDAEGRPKPHQMGER